MSAFTDKIRSRGHWWVIIRPRRFDRDRVPFAELEETLSSAAVRFRGWPVPFIDQRLQPMRSNYWIGQDVDAQMVSHYEAWRFFTSGQLNHLRTVSADWRSGAEATHVPAGFRSAIEVWEILFYLTEVFELSARLALSPAGDDSMTVEVTLDGLGERALIVGQGNRAEFIEPYRAPSGPLRRIIETQRDDLVGQARDLAVDTARDMFLRFGWHPSRPQLVDHQQELLSYR